MQVQDAEGHFRVADNGDGFYRLAFSSMEYEKMVFATKVIAETTQEFFASA